MKSHYKMRAVRLPEGLYLSKQDLLDLLESIQLDDLYVEVQKLIDGINKMKVNYEKD